jgi:tripartite ATP-independent transporter DctP family solute receptor
MPGSRIAGTMKRSTFVASMAGAAALGNAAPARAAQFEYKFSHGFVSKFPEHKLIADACAAINKESGGRLNITVFANNVLGSELAQLSQLRSGAIQFMVIQGVSISSVVPGIPFDGIGFAFKSAAEAEHAFDGPLGDQLRSELLAKKIVGFPKVMNLGMRQVTSSSHPIHTASDFGGFKIRTPPADIVVDLFKTLGASPTPIVFPELYLSLQTHVVDGQETPYNTIEFAKFYEVQKFLSVTNHMATIFWTLGNNDAFQALPPDLREIVVRNFNKASLLERQATARNAAELAAKLKTQGVTFNDADVASMRKQLGPFYARWKDRLGSKAWALLEQTSGKLG